MVGSTGAAVIVFALAWIWVLRQQDDGVDEIMANVRRTLIPHSHNGTGYGVILRGEVSGDTPDYTRTMSYDDMGRFLIVAEYHDTRIDGYSYGHDGVVTWSADRYGYGIMVEINHGNGYSTRYAHNSENLVAVGDEVKKGQQVALMGETGRATGPNLHFEVLQNGRRVNPVTFIRQDAD
jgi:hypothetical protein